MKPKSSKRNKRIVVASLAVLLLGGTAYKLADRYLIEHVEAVVADSAVSASAAEAVSADAGSSVNGASGTGAAGLSGSAGTTGSGSASAAAIADAAGAQYDDWNYKSDDLSVSIKKVVTGSGSDQITYYVADVQAADASLLQSAFAKNEFGRNITEATSAIASDHGAIFAVNGDYYGFRGDGVIIRNGVLYRNEPAREAVAFYKDGTMASYDEQEVSAETLLKNGVIDTYSFGPALVKDGEVVNNLDNVKIDTNFGNRAISGSNPRTGVGMIAPNHYVFVVVDGRQDVSRGMTLNEFAQLFHELGATEAYNLDGGGSSTMYFMGHVVNNPQGKQRERGVSDIIYLGEG